MVPQLYKVLTRDEGFLAVMGRPRAGDWLEDEARGLRSLGVDTVASLLELSEEVALDLGLERQAIESLGMRFVSFPIADRGVPANPRDFGAFASGLAAEVQGGRGVAVHCRAGIGRSGITAAAVLVASGRSPDEVFSVISEARGLQVPDTEAQIRWFHEHFGRAPREPKL
jgi:protein-tyrosine phosphatase